MICSFECTFCRDCVEGTLMNVCPNCGGGLNPRPIRPKGKLEKNPAGTRVVEKPIDAGAHAAFAARVVEKPIDAGAHAAFAASIKDVPPELR
jgi:hypothetical protein